MNQIEATILGQSYMLACPPGGEQQLQQAVAIVDREMSAIRDAGRVKARERIAVLTALNLAYQKVEQSRAERAERAEPAASAPPAPRAAGGAGASGAADLPEAELARLVQRIDDALGADGQLL